MRTTVVIDDALLKEAMSIIKAKTKREAIETALREIVRKKHLDSLREKLGNYDLDLTLEELERLRSEP